MMMAGSERKCGRPAWYELSIDGVGTYRLTLRHAVVLGRPPESALRGPFPEELAARRPPREGGPVAAEVRDATPSSEPRQPKPAARTAESGEAFLALLGRLARRHARIVRVGEGYRLEAFAECTVESTPVRESLWLPSAARIVLGGVPVRFARPLAAGSTALLWFEEVNRTLESVEGVILLGDLLLIGARRGHLRGADLESELVLLPRIDRQTGGVDFRLHARPLEGPTAATASEMSPDRSGCWHVGGRAICVRPLADPEAESG